MPWAHFQAFPLSPGRGIFDSITNILPTLLNTTVLPMSTSLFEAVSCPPPPTYSANLSPYSSLQVLTQTPPYKDVLAQSNDNGFPCIFLLNSALIILYLTTYPRNDVPQRLRFT